MKIALMSFLIALPFVSSALAESWQPNGSYSGTCDSSANISLNFSVKDGKLIIAGEVVSDYNGQKLAGTILSMYNISSEGKLSSSGRVKTQGQCSNKVCEIQSILELADAGYLSEEVSTYIFSEDLLVTNSLSTTMQGGEFTRSLSACTLNKIK